MVKVHSGIPFDDSISPVKEQSSGLKFFIAYSVFFLQNMTIFLKDLVFYAPHGLYAGEESVGSRYLVQARIEYLPGYETIKGIEDTIDYEKVYLVIAEKMRKKESLIETLAIDIARQILNTFSKADTVQIKIEKCNPPIKGMEGSVAVEYTAVKFQDFGKT